MQIQTSQLEIPQLESEVIWICDFLAEIGLPLFQVMYGWGCNVDEQYGLWQNVPVQAGELYAYVHSCRRSGAFELGNADLRIQSPDSDLEFLLCHESDVHFEADNNELIEAVRTVWIGRGYGGWDRQGERPPYEFKPWNARNHEARAD